MLIFAEQDLSYFLRKQDGYMKYEIENISEDYLLNVNEQEYLEYIKNKYHIEGLDIHWDKACFFECEKTTNTMDDFRNSIIECKRIIITIEIPFMGNRMLFEYYPNPRLLWQQEVILNDSKISFNIPLIRVEEAENVNVEYQRIKDNISKQLINLNNNINVFNNHILDIATGIFKTRKNMILSKKTNLMKINIPLKANENMPKTFSIPPVSKRKDIISPLAKTKSCIPEPALDMSMYREILANINDTGKEFERLPSTSKGKGEEALRDFILFVLQPHFKGSATGETFNHTGKTDILLRYENSNVFVGECKFWKGETGYLATIDQLFNYLTWRDSKAAVIIFVRNREFTKVIEKIKEATPKHSNYISHKEDTDETWFNYLFHFNGDEDRKVHLAVMVYNIPS